MPDAPIIEWTALEYEHKDRSNDWLWSMGLGASVLTLILFYFSNFLFGLVVILSAVVIILYAKRPPQEVHFAITGKGIKAGHDLYPFTSIKDFSLPKQGDKLVIESSRIFLPRLIIPLRPELSSGIRAELSKKIKEVEYEEHLLDTLADRLGF